MGAFDFDADQILEEEYNGDPLEMELKASVSLGRQSSVDSAVIVNCTSIYSSNVLWSLNDKPLDATQHGYFMQEPPRERATATKSYDNILKWFPHESLYNQSLTLHCHVDASTDKIAHFVLGKLKTRPYKTQVKHIAFLICLPVFPTTHSSHST